MALPTDFGAIPSAAQPFAANNVNLIVNASHSLYSQEHSLKDLSQVKGRYPATHREYAFPVFKLKTRNTMVKMAMAVQLLASKLFDLGSLCKWLLFAFPR